MNSVTIPPELLEQLRILLAIGLFATLFGVMYELTASLEGKSKSARVARRDRRQTYELCKLHQRPVHECRDMHDQEEKTDE